MGQEFKMVGRQGLDQGVRDSYKPDRSWHWGRIPDRGWDGVPDTWWGSTQGWDSSQVVGYQI